MTTQEAINDLRAHGIRETVSVETHVWDRSYTANQDTEYVVFVILDADQTIMAKNEELAEAVWLTKAKYDAIFEAANGTPTSEVQ